jgi:hypothetical protein
MPSYVSRHNPRVNYFATPEWHSKVEELLDRLEAWERGSAAYTIEQIVVTHRIVKGRAIHAELLRRCSDLADGEARVEDLIDVSALLEAAFRQENESSSAIYDCMAALEQQPLAQDPTRAKVDADALVKMEDNIDRALEAEDRGERRG